jgi:hypothetical protein
MVGLYCMLAPDIERLPLPGRHRATLSARPHQDHVRNLQEFAHAQRERVRISSLNFQLADAMGRSFRAHFPNQATHADEWNSLDTSTPSRRCSERLSKEVAALNIGVGNSLWNLLMCVADGSVVLAELQWGVNGDQIIAAIDADQVWFVSPTIPSSIADQTDLLRRVGDVVSRTPTLPEVLAQNEANARRKHLRELVLDDLDVIEHDHDIARQLDCKYCQVRGGN